jgi:hypothetical protein
LLEQVAPDLPGPERLDLYRAGVEESVEKGANHINVTVNRAVAHAALLAQVVFVTSAMQANRREIGDARALRDDALRAEVAQKVKRSHTPTVALFLPVLDIHLDK